jgi:hypothetical protein
MEDIGLENMCALIFTPPVCGAYLYFLPMQFQLDMDFCSVHLRNSQQLKHKNIKF